MTHRQQNTNDKPPSRMKQVTERNMHLSASWAAFSAGRNNRRQPTSLKVQGKRMNSRAFSMAKLRIGG